MAKQLIGIGSTANDGTGDNLREGATKVNNVFNELYTALGDGTSISSGTFVTTAAAQTVTNKNLTAATNTFPTLSIKDDASTIDVVNLGETITFEGGSGITTTVTDNKITFDTDGSIVTETSTDTLTNKSIDLADNTLTGTTTQFNTAVSDGNFSTTSGSETLTNKGIDLTDNTLTGTLAEFNTAISDETVVGRATTDTLTNKSISGGTNTLSNIANGSLTNSAVTLGATSVALGATAAAASNFNITGSSSLSGTGTVSTTGSANKLRFNFANVSSLPAAADYEGMFAYDIGANDPYVADAGGWVKLFNENNTLQDISNVSITGIENRHVLKWNSSTTRFESAAESQDATYISHRSPDATITQTLAVTVATKTTEHTAYGDGSSSGYLIDGHEGAHLSMSPGVYKFDQADSSNSGHPLLFYREAAKTTAYTTGVVTSGTPGSSGAHTTITITKDTPSTLHYQCSAHANMGGVLSNIGSESPTIRMIDNDKAIFGTGGDLEIFHNPSSGNSFIKDVGTGALILGSDGTKILLQKTDGESMGVFNTDGAVELYHNNVKKFDTTSTGIDVTGEVLADKAYIAETTLTDQATVAWDMATQSVCKLTLGGSRTLAAPSNGSTGQFASILVIQDGTGSRTLTWNAVYEFASDTAPTLTTTANLGDLFTFRYNGAKWLEVGKNQALTLS